MAEDPSVTCTSCGREMNRVPQPFTYYHSPWLTMAEEDEREFAEIIREEKQNTWKNKSVEGIVK
jgi:hypothetical protein